MPLIFLTYRLWAALICITLMINTSVAMKDKDQDVHAEGLPKRYGVLLFPAFELLDVFGPLEALQLLSRQYQMDLALISQTMDPVSTRPRSPSMNPKNSTFFPSIVPTHTLDNASDLDVLLIPGGPGMRAPDLNTTLEFIATTYPKLQYLLTVCTGAGLAASAGVLDGKRATTNKASWESMIARGPKVNWVAQARWIEDGNVWTSSGISAGIDMTLAFIGHVYGEGVAVGLANLMEYDWHRDPDWDPFAGIFNVTQP